METLCKIRDIYRLIYDFEQNFEKRFDLSLNEGMLLCSLNDSEKLSSGEIASALGLTCSNTSKVIKSVEKKNLIERVIGAEDKRQMYFSLTSKGRDTINNIKSSGIEIPEALTRLVSVRRCVFQYYSP